MQSLTALVSTILSKTSITVEPINVKKGWSDNHVYVVADNETREKVPFIKTFKFDAAKNGYPNMLDELQGLRMLQGIKGVSATKLEGLGQFKLKNDHYFVMAQSPASGASIYDYYLQVGDKPVGSHEGMQKINLLKEACNACGKALAKLHTHSQRENKPLPDNLKVSQTYLNV